MLSKILIITSLFAVILAKDNLTTDQCLNKGESIVSSNGCFRLTMQDDGNLVIYKQSNGKALWSSKTSKSCSNRACMQGDGNFVLYDCHNKATWASKTSKHEAASIIMQNDGNLVIYKPFTGRAIWSSKTVTSC